MKRLSILLFGVLLIAAGLYAFQSKEKLDEWVYPEVKHPSDNLPTEARINLGSDLFFETLLSRDSTISCQSCHKIDEAFADHLSLGEGIKGRHVTRNTPSVFNIGLHPYMMKDGKIPSLEAQVLAPINEHREFDMSPEEVVQRLQTRPYYVSLSKKAYGKTIDIDVVQKSLAVFQRIIKAENSPFDAYMRGDDTSLTEKQKRGWKLFQTEELNCIQCHSGFDFTDYSFQNNGLYQNYVDSGRALVSGQQEDIGKFKVPSLRNVAITYPYMHNGAVSSLEEVLAHYASGGQQHANQSEFVKGFELNKADQEALIAFLQSLTERRFLAD